MPSARIVGAGVVAAMIFAAAASGATAQTATAEPVGQPLALLAGLKPPPETRTVHHAKTAHRRTGKIAAKTRSSRVTKKLAAEHKRHRAVKRIAAEKDKVRAAGVAAAAPAAPAAPAVQTVAQPVSDPAAATIWPAADATPPAAAAAVAAAPPPSAAPSAGDPQQSAVVVNGQTVQVDSPDQVNAIDRAADDDTPPAKAADRADAAAPPSQTVLAAPVHRDASPVGSASWIAQVLAAFGGAVAAGAVAWFLIGSGPVRTYG